MTIWWYVCESCGLGFPEDQPSVDISKCDHPVWKLVKQQKDVEE